MTVKRITYLTRRADLTPDQFRAHWSTVHAEIARDLPRVVAYRQNHIVRPDDPAGAEQWDLDGIVELWFADEEAAAAGFGSEVADRLVVDERRFLSGLVGGAVDAPAPPPERAGKLWLLWRETPESDQLEPRVAELARVLGADTVQTNRRQVDASVLRRDGLRRQDLPAVAVALSFGTVAAALAAGESLRTGPGVLGAQLVVAAEVPII